MVSHVFPLAALREKEVCLFLTLIIKEKKKIPTTEIIARLASKIDAILPVAEVRLFSPCSCLGEVSWLVACSLVWYSSLGG